MLEHVSKQVGTCQNTCQHKCQTWCQNTCPLMSEHMPANKWCTLILVKSTQSIGFWVVPVEQPSVQLIWSADQCTQTLKALFCRLHVRSCVVPCVRCHAFLAGVRLKWHTTSSLVTPQMKRPSMDECALPEGICNHPEKPKREQSLTHSQKRFLFYKAVTATKLYQQMGSVAKHLSNSSCRSLFRTQSGQSRDSCPMTLVTESFCIKESLSP